MTPEVSHLVTEEEKDEKDSKNSFCLGADGFGNRASSHGRSVFQKRQMQECALCGKPRPGSKYQSWSNQRHSLFGGWRKVCNLHVS